MLHHVEVQVGGSWQRLVRRHFVRVLQRFEGRHNGVIDFLRTALRHARRGERRIIAQHPIGLRPMIPRGLVGLDPERRGDGERQYQQDRDHSAASHPETSHRLKNPSEKRTGQRFVNLAGPFPDKPAGWTLIHLARNEK